MRDAASAVLCVLAMAATAVAKPTQMVVFGDSLADDGGVRSFRAISTAALAATFAQPYPAGQGLDAAAALTAAQPFVRARRAPAGRSRGVERCTAASAPQRTPAPWLGISNPHWCLTTTQPHNHMRANHNTRSGPARR